MSDRRCWSKRSNFVFKLLARDLKDNLTGYGQVSRDAMLQMMCGIPATRILKEVEHAEMCKQFFPPLSCECGPEDPRSCNLVIGRRSSWGLFT